MNFADAEWFKKKGINKAKAQRYQCKQCLKITSVMPERKNSTTYHQKRNDILLDLAKAVVNKVAINRTIEMLDIGVKTYYEKLELVYKRCLEFLERHEKKALKNLNIDECWLNTDKMTYHLSNVRKKGHGRKPPAERSEESKFPTHIVITRKCKADTSSWLMLPMIGISLLMTWHWILSSIKMTTYMNWLKKMQGLEEALPPIQCRLTPLTIKVWRNMKMTLPDLKSEVSTWMAYMLTPLIQRLLIIG
ncbi:hypothetical protein [Neobacillus kokaensis]|uniref:Transposase n=1 Tax=Neobacillus kokaensis TaxID=2759023 RepID=A0ABQ3NCJ6_9BACI|nr:hypothetical protein [Neobacillus kokaensis]GHI01640.1 hypothetical protein AM1BK_51820 [Neobacillus kokaensis]